MLPFLFVSGVSPVTILGEPLGGDEPSSECSLGDFCSGLRGDFVGSSGCRGE